MLPMWALAVPIGVSSVAWVLSFAMLVVPFPFAAHTCAGGEDGLIV